MKKHEMKAQKRNLRPLLRVMRLGFVNNLWKTTKICDFSLLLTLFFENYTSIFGVYLKILELRTCREETILLEEKQ